MKRKIAPFLILAFIVTGLSSCYMYGHQDHRRGHRGGYRSEHRREHHREHTKGHSEHHRAD